MACPLGLRGRLVWFPICALPLLTRPRLLTPPTAGFQAPPPQLVPRNRTLGREPQATPAASFM